VGLAAAREQWRVGARLAAAATQARASLAVPAAPIDLLHLERWAALCHAQLSPDVVEAARSEGVAMTVDQATGHALTQVAIIREEQVSEIS
jgi:hypothetical protein